VFPLKEEKQNKTIVQLVEQKVGEIKVKGKLRVVKDYLDPGPR
jgi:hypothetical protein